MKTTSRFAVLLLVAAVIRSALGQDLATDGRLKLMVFGDVNLGRAVGQQIVKGNAGYPFAFVRDSLWRADVVFLNLESQLSEQKGETQHPRYNLIFTGPSEGARSLKDANVSVVSTANNHAFDYGQRALAETIENLRKSGIQFVGTSADSVDQSTPAIIEKNGIRIGFLAYSQFVNLKGNWKGRIDVYERGRVARDLGALRPLVDFVVVSYHAGAEYVDKPSDPLRNEFRHFVDCGADVVVGHHPHYVQGIELYRGKLLFFSLGNFVFYQPQREWTQFGLGLEIDLVRRNPRIQISRVGLDVVRAGLQPAFNVSDAERRSFFQRLLSLSSAAIVNLDGSYVLDLKEINEK